MKRYVGFICFSVSLLFIFNFSLLSGIQNVFSSVASAIAGGIPQKLPLLQAGPDGSANTEIEIELPPGKVVPSLSLSYNSNGGNTIVGMGWSLNGLPTVTRNPSYGIGYNGKDSYVSSLAGELIDISGNKTVYHSKKESYLKFEPQGTCGDGPCTWIATDKDGKRFLFGGTIDSRIAALGRTAGSIREWALSREEDSHANGYDVNYTPIDVNSGDYYPSTITYNDRTIRFNFENRNDRIPNYSLGTIERIQKRLDTIEILVSGNGFRTYDLDYTYGQVTGRSIFRKLKQSGNNTFGSENFADLDFTYTNHSGGFSPGNITYQDLTNRASMNVFIPNIVVDAMNFILNGNLPYHPSALDANIDASLQYIVKVPVPDRNACSLGLASCLCALLPVCWGGNQHFLEYLSGNCWSFMGWGGLGACDFGVDSALTAWLPMDLNGDGITDFATLNGNEADGSIHLVGHIQKIGQPASSFNGPNIPIHYNTFYQVVDLNGDGKTDFVYEDGGRLWGVYSTAGNFSSPVLFGNVSLNSANRDMHVFSPYEYKFHYGPNNTTPLAGDRSAKDFFGDVNGDELVDFIHNNGGSFSIYLNRETYFDNPIVIGGGGDFYLNSMIDFTGDGKADYVQLVQTYDNSTLTTLQAQKSALDTLMAQYQTEHARVKAVVDQMPTPTTHATIDDTEFQNLLDYLTANGYEPLSDSLESDGKDYPYTPAQVASLQTFLENIVSARMNFVGQQSYAINNQIAAIYAQGNLGQATYALQVRTFNLTNGTSQNVVYPLFNSVNPDKSTLADVNGDGVLDFVSFVGTQSIVCIFTGNGFSNPIATNLNAGNGKNLLDFSFGEVNGDGISDLVLFNKENHTIETYLSVGNGTFSYSSGFSFGVFSTQEYTDSNGIERSDTYQISLQDMNLDGISDVSIAFLSLDKTWGGIFYRYNNPRNSGEDQLLSVTNGAGQNSQVQYQLKNTHPGALQPGTANYPDGPSMNPGFLVTQTRQDLSNGIVHTTNYGYTNERHILGTRNISRSLGFSNIRETDVNTNFYKITDYFQNDYRLAGVVQNQRSYNASNNLTGSTTHSGFSFPNPFGTEIVLPGVVTNSDYKNGTLVETSIQNFSYDSFGFTTSVVESLGSHTITNTSQVSNNVAGWRMGRVVRSRKNVDGTWVEDVSLGYTGDNLTSKTIFPSSASPITTTFTYDTFGNVVSVTEPSGGVSLISYDVVLNLFPVTKTNALGHVTTSNYDFATGLETSTTDPNGAITLTSYDPYGRKASVTYPGEGSPNETYIYSNTGEYDLTNLNNNEFVTKSIRDNVSGSVNVSKIFTDPLGNTIRSEANTALSGINSIEESFFDYTKGVLIRKSNEYYTSLTPQFTTYQYNDPDGELTSILEPSASGTIQTSITKTGFTETKTSTFPDGQTKTEIITKNELGQLISKTENGRTILTNYSPFGAISSVADVGGLTTSFVYDSFGRRISVQDPNSGTISFSYDSLGRLYSQTDARGKTITFTYDLLGRPLTQTTNGPEAPVQFVYDDSNVPFSRGHLTSVTDGSGRTEFRFDLKGNPIQKTKYVDDITAIFKRDYDSLSRPMTEVLPDGTKLHNFYSSNGTLSSITMDTADGTSSGHTVVSYQGPYLDSNGVPSLRRTSGNGVTMEIGFEPLDKKPLSVVSKKPDGTVIGNTEFTYDSKGYITKIEDKLNSRRTQNFTLDNLGRVTQAVGKYGTQNYSFSANGNLIQKGAYTLGYTDASHANAVTTATSASTGTLNYGYDASGNMVSRNGDTLRYDSFGKLIEITPYATSNSIRNVYDFQGNRVKSVSDITLISTYTLGENYEIVREPGKPEKHTLYVKGLEGDLVAQWTREDATLRISGIDLERDRLVFGNIFSSIFKPFCKEVTGDCGTYYKNRFESEFIGIFGYSKLFQVGIPTPLYKAIYFLLLLAVIYLVYPYFLKSNLLLQNLGWKGVGTPALILSLFVVTSLPGCGVLPGTGGKDGDPPWVLALGANVAPGVPSIQNPGVGMTGGGSVGGVPVTGMFFFHPDHLGSITMITDGAGNPASGPEPGTSFVSYEPYGSIIRNDSYGPDIFRYKFTGQVEDKETGLYFYKARYYEPILGRFIQADSVLMPTNVNGLNRYMYVDGNPVNYRDVSGHVSGSGLMHMVNRIIGHAMGKDFNSKGLDKKLSTSGFSTGGNRFVKRGFSAPSKVGTKNAWKQAVLAGLQTNWDLNAMAQGYYYGHKDAKDKRKQQIKTGWGVTTMATGAVVMSIGVVMVIKENYWGATVFGIGASIFSHGYDLYKNKNSKKIIWCGAESGSSPYCMYINSDLGLGASSEAGNGSNGYAIPIEYY
ncbi:RHS repeat-associated core domain-containing protein [Leptospira noguchii]|uniref:RHS repeat-associated core domain protein n=1 Tax=Leptospira noguchii TaxID=28182 RepID=M6VD07_9LEPT|nr:RHS repeat-associated core domain-containing protein [Leptospira noguchii]EMO54765.1 RHS repeat-associated core domain protein [Leptospira noguchii]